MRAVIQIFLNSIERLHCRAARIIFYLPKYMALEKCLIMTQWSNCFLYYKLDIFKLFYKAHNGSLPNSLSTSIFKKRCNGYALRGQDCLQIPRFNTRYMKDSLEYRGSTLWNTVHALQRSRSGTPAIQRLEGLAYNNGLF